ncbi:MAG: GNAT family N-acetyltransferase [Deltaproteobacteria bacterium]|nr:GNAT family N-acetyltransferase [Deltaproteobacteria bacterium]
MELNSYPKRVLLKDGTEIFLRLMVKEDEKELFRFFSSLPEEDRLFLREDVTKEETVRRFSERLNYREILPVLAMNNNRVVGDATLHMNPHGWKRHIGEIRMVVARQFQKHGLGTILAKELVKNAINLGLDKIIAEVAERQTGALKAFKKLGFLQEAVLKEHIQDISGLKRDLIILSNNVGELWSRMEDMMSDYRPPDGS